MATARRAAAKQALVGSKTETNGADVPYFATLPEAAPTEDLCSAALSSVFDVKVGPLVRLVDIDLWNYRVVRSRTATDGSLYHVTLFEHEARRLVRDLLSALDT